MKRVNVHHFPENPFEEPPMVHRHHSSHNRRQSFGRSHYNSSMRNSRRQHSLASSYANRSARQNFDSAQLSRMQEPVEVPIPNETNSLETTTVSTPDEEPISPTVQLKLPAPLNSVTLNEHNRIVANFIENYLSHDGSLVLYILKINTNEVITGEIVTTLFEIFKTNYRIDTTN
ncbi:unnamed protein product [Rotaria socialis]|nr:unnamed protein product [Rotaria socialis]CAF3397288.1 unnamed protein product [Rotaria socialis]CAF4995800.1 unnamed protein product [Rotaria socialis]